METSPRLRPCSWAPGKPPPWTWRAPIVCLPTAACAPRHTFIDHITDSKGQPRFAITKSRRAVYSQRAANITSSILQQVCKPGGTAGRITALGFKAPCGGKTGTTNNYTNAWFAGYTSNLTCSVWVGFDTATKILEKGYGGTLALPIWTDIMLASQKEGYPFNAIRTRAASEGQAVLVCRESNQLAHSGLPIRQNGLL